MAANVAHRNRYIAGQRELNITMTERISESDMERLLMLHMYLSSERRLPGALLLLTAQANRTRARLYTKHVHKHTEQAHGTATVLFKPSTS